MTTRSPISKSAKPQLDAETPSTTETATFALGCFWSPEARFGSLPGVVCTRVGYAGGTMQNPTYHNLGDYIEAVQLTYDPELITYEDLLDRFWSNHDPTRRPWKRQYTPALFTHDDRQEQLAQATKEKIAGSTTSPVRTEILPASPFYLAEDYHQKYHLQQQPVLRDEYRDIYPNLEDFVDSPAATRVNGYVAGYGTVERLNADLDRLGISPAGQKKLQEIVRAGR